MHNSYQIFDAARLELTRGVNLVEASAGTGKTYAIGMLVLRAVVELHQPIDKILIVTFTKAATEELKTRIRARLIEARDLLNGKLINQAEKIDQTLLDWASTVDDPQVALNLLQLALYDIDRAGIFTIHGFCQRMLVEQALESGQLFDVELLADINHVRNEVADDFWRNHIYPLDPLPCSLITGCFAAPENLLASVAAVFGDNGRLDPQVGRIDEVLVELKTAMAGMIAWWLEYKDSLYDCFAAGLAEERFKKPFTDAFAAWFAALCSFFTETSWLVPGNLHLLGREALAGELNGQRIRGDAKKLAYLADWPLPEHEIAALLTAIDKLVLTFRVKLAEELRTEVSRRLLQQGNMGFNDLIISLSAALRGERGHSLQQLLGDRFAVALIDEFQDTDNAQWHIFSTLFGGGKHYLYLIGDPKQAIYKFRGADIHSYFLARESADTLLTLEKNYRSHPFLVAEINRLFGSRKRPFFFEEKMLGYYPTTAAKQEKDIDLVQHGKSLAGMVYCTLVPDPEEKNGRWTSGKAAAALRGFVINELGRLLDPTAPALLQKSSQEPHQRPLAPQDIAILVRSNRQAEEYRQALAEAAIPAVIGSRQSVFQTSECREMLLLLQGIAAPGETAKLKSAMAISWFGFSGNRLCQIWQDEQQVSHYHSQFLQYYRSWQEQGFLPMMSRLLIEEGVLPTLAAGKLAERSIANIQHLLELVQEQENAENLGITQLLQWLHKMMQDDRSAENAELQLESDEQAVRIVTMHSSKGLEYPVVFCPYLWYSSKRTQAEKYQVSCHDAEHQLVIDLGSDQFVARREQAVEEEMAEDLRLLYVALTRAQVCCYTAWADVKPSGRTVGDSCHSALGYLLFPDGPVDYQAQQEKFGSLAQDKAVHHRIVASTEPLLRKPSIIAVQDLQPLQVSGRSLYTDWQMSSFSSLASISEYDHEEPSLQTKSMHTSQPGTVAVTGLPAGPNFGNVIHDLLESLSFSAISGQELQGTLVDLVVHKCTRYGVDAAPGAVQKLLELIVATPLTEDSFSLAMLDESQCLKEMEFYFHLSSLATEQINSILAEEPTVTPLGHKQMRGYLTGFVDLIGEYAGKYYIFDYKTNFLGESMADYAADKLVAAMQSHNYGLQYWIYTLVLHRHLQNIMPSYRYEQHFGGVRYLFVRGMSPELPGSGVYCTVPDYNKVLALDLAIGGVDDEQAGV